MDLRGRFGGVAGTATGIAKILFFVFLIIFVISLVIPTFEMSGYLPALWESLETELAGTA